MNTYLSGHGGMSKLLGDAWPDRSGRERARSLPETGNSRVFPLVEDRWRRGCLVS